MTASRRLFEACCLTIVGGGREASSVWGRGTQSILRARGPSRTWSCGPSTSPLDSMPEFAARSDRGGSLRLADRLMRDHVRLGILGALTASFVISVGAAQPVPIRLRPATSESSAMAAIESSFAHGPASEGHVRTFQMLDDTIALAFVETWPPRWSGLFLVNVATREISQVITPLGQVSASARDLSGNVWTIVKGESDVPDYIEHNY